MRDHRARGIGAGRAAAVDRYILRVGGPFGYLPVYEGHHAGYSRQARYLHRVKVAGADRCGLARAAMLFMARMVRLSSGSHGPDSEPAGFQNVIMA